MVQLAHLGQEEIRVAEDQKATLGIPAPWESRVIRVKSVNREPLDLPDLWALRETR